jgi:glycosyltransferase involved in cell wall biosynthesis
MPKLILNTIVKNESHVILKMLESAIKISDAIIILDTGSTDGTQDMILDYGKKNNIPTYVFNRDFDNFENSRNFAMEKARETVANELQWNPDDCFTWWCDADETVIVDPEFSKSQFVNDLYMINAFIGKMKYTRNTFARVSKPFRWYGPIHEFITTDDRTVTSGLAKHLHINVEMTGASWKGNIPEKYKSHASILEKYINEDRSDPRWIFYTAQSYHDSASIPNNIEENHERLRRSLKYYRERVNRRDGYYEEIFYSQYKIGSIMKILEEPWNLTHQELLKAYSIDPIRGESIKTIIDYYLQVGEFNLAYLYAKFAKVNFHGKIPHQRKLFIDESLYMWRFAELHSLSSFYTNRKDESKQSYMEILNLLQTNKEYFNEEDIKKIESNKQYFI